MSLFLVFIKDKELAGEPHVGFGIVEAVDEDAARRAAEPDVDKLREEGRGRVHAVVAGTVDIGTFYSTRRLGPQPIDLMPSVTHYLRCSKCGAPYVLRRGLLVGASRYAWRWFPDCRHKAAPPSDDVEKDV